jgi:hypothetical protein
MRQQQQQGWQVSLGMRQQQQQQQGWQVSLGMRLLVLLVLLGYRLCPTVASQGMRQGLLQGVVAQRMSVRLLPAVLVLLGVAVRVHKRAGGQM